ncbi:MAG: zinc ribbon domain-containing protein [Clostridia bacterium]|nr:zinc ribbon domain-containing protein [Clostridia bacterium]
MTADEFRLTKLEYMRQSNMEQYGFGPNIMRNIRICPDCGLPSIVTDRNCHACGAKLPRETLFQQYKKRHRFCPRCDTVVAKSAQFCPECGTRIGWIKPWAAVLK